MLDRPSTFVIRARRPAVARTLEALSESRQFCFEVADCPGSGGLDMVSAWPMLVSWGRMLGHFRSSASRDTWKARFTSANSELW